MMIVCRTFLSDSFSSFISFSLAFTAARVALSLVRCANEVSPEPGRKAFFGACHCLPIQITSVSQRRLVCILMFEHIPFTLMPCCFGAVEGTGFAPASLTVVDMVQRSSKMPNERYCNAEAVRLVCSKHKVGFVNRRAWGWP